MNEQQDREAILAALSDFFEPAEVEWKPQAVKGNRALAIAYIDARCVMDRLDRVLGVGNWQTSYREFGEGVVCALRVRVCGEWSEHEDAGSFSDQPDKGDKLKAAFSDALKRAAVHLGIGRYLYSLPSQWVDFDPQKKAFVRKPDLPAWARPKKSGSQQPRPAPAEKPADSEPDAGDHRESRKVTAEELSELHALVEESGYKWAKWLKWLKAKGFPVTQTTSMADVTLDAYEVLLPSLQKAGAERKPAN